MEIPYYKNGKLEHPLKVNAIFWQGCQSRSKRVMDRNTDKLWRIVRERHPNATRINLCFRDFNIESED